MTADHWHVYPLRDLIDHETESEDCVCKPAVAPLMREDGSCGWIYTHHSLDGREFSEESNNP